MQAFEPRPPPLTTGSDGVIRVVGTRLPLETIIASFDSGATAEEIVQQYPTLELGDVYAIIAYILSTQGALRKYMDQRHAAAQAVRCEIEEQQPSDGIRERLLARRAQPDPR